MANVTPAYDKNGQLRKVSPKGACSWEDRIRVISIARGVCPSCYSLELVTVAELSQIFYRLERGEELARSQVRTAYEGDSQDSKSPRLV